MKGARHSMDMKQRVKRKMNKVDFLKQISLQQMVFNKHISNFFCDLSAELHHSTAIEGNTITLCETRKLLNGIEIEGGTAYEKYQILDLAKAYTMSNEHIGTPLSIELIEKLHMKVQCHTSMNSGVLRSELRDNRISQGFGEIYSDYSVVDAELNQICASFNSSMHFHRLEHIINMTMDFVLIHPFTDCNGRLSRLLLNWALIKNEYIPVTIKVMDKAKYIEALNTSRLKRNYLYLLEYVLDLLIKEYETLSN